LGETKRRAVPWSAKTAKQTVAKPIVVSKQQQPPRHMHTAQDIIIPSKLDYTSDQTAEQTVDYYYHSYYYCKSLGNESISQEVKRQKPVVLFL
jgi:hypothetical protein